MSKVEIECPDCGTSELDKSSFIDTLKDSGKAGLGAGAAAILLKIAFLPAVIVGGVSVAVYKALKGTMVTCADCGHEWRVK